LCYISPMLPRTSDFLFTFVLPAAADYEAAEDALTQAHRDSPNPELQQKAGELAIRRACEVAVAIDALIDRAALELNIRIPDMRARIDPLCAIETYLRDGAIVRVSGAANAYKHGNLDANRHPISSDGDVLATSAGYGIDGYGLGKYAGIEVILTLKGGEQRKFIPDVQYAIAGWLRLLKIEGTPLPAAPIMVLGVDVYPH